MTKFFRRMVCILLTTAMMVMLLPMQALAYYTDEESAGVPFVDSAGNTVSSDESWEDVFPYGTFAFANNQVDVLEGGEKQKITIYRLGGTTGRAEAYIKYEPALSEIDDGQIYYASAIGASDITIEVEDPMPIAQYQPLGKETPPEAAGFAAVIDEEKCTTDVFAEDGETVETYGDVFITLDMQADSYQWYTLVEGEWQIIDLATDAYLLVSNEHYPDYDFRCEYKIGGGKFCTDSVKGAVYEAPEEEILPELPEGGVELDPEITYSKIEMDEEFAGYAFKVVFAEDEWVKDILIDTVDDDIKEGEEFALFTIFDC